MAKQHHNKSPFCFEETTKPFFGSLAKAAAALGQFEGQVCEPELFLDIIENQFCELYQSIEWIRFHRWQEAEAEWRIAVVNTIPNWTLRKAFYEARTDITKKTGWYPLVQGSRARFGALPAPVNTWDSEAMKPKLDIGLLQSVVQVASGENEGSAFGIKGERGIVLADTGLDGNLRLTRKPRFVFVSHFHSDHSGGLDGVLEQKDSAILMSQQTYAHLASEHRPRRSRVSLELRAQAIPYPSSFRLRSGSYLQFFPTLHCPGSCGFLYRDSSGKTVVYPGDVCLRNSFADFRVQLKQLFTEAARSPTTVLLDGAMLERRNQEIPAEDTLDSLLDEALRGVRSRNIVYLSDQSETMIYSYIVAFARFIKAGLRPPFFVAPGLLKHLRIFWQRTFQERGSVADPVLRTLGKRFYQNFSESQQLYPLTDSALDALPTNEHCVVFTDIRSVGSCVRLMPRLENADVILLGTLALRDHDFSDLFSVRPRMLLRAAGPSWSFHSSQEDLKDFCADCCTLGIRVLLFHNFEQRLKRFVRNGGFDATLIRTIGRESVAL